MRLRLDQLETLIWIARLGSFRAAAARLNLTQPSISLRIRELEQAIGAPLFERLGNRVRLTTRGHDAVAHAEQILRLAGELERSGGSDRLRGPIRIGVADTFALTCLPDLLLDIEAGHPEAQIELEVNYSAVLDVQLQRGELDLAVLTAPSPAHGICTEPLVHLQLDWVAAPRLDLPDRPVTPADIVDLPIISNPRPSHLWSTIRAWFASAGLEPARVNSCNALSIMARLAASGFGVSLLPTAILQDELRSGALRVLQARPALEPHWLSVSWRTDSGQDLGLIAAMAQRVVVSRRLGQAA